MLEVEDQEAPRKSGAAPATEGGTPPVRHATLFRYLFLTLWFVAVPLVLAGITVQALKAPADLFFATGFFDQLRLAVRDQPFPAGILLFTIFEMALWPLRHRLPLASRLSVGGRHDLPLAVRSDFEAAGHLADELERILQRRAKAVEREVAFKTRKEIGDAVEELRGTMRRSPFDEVAFYDALDRTHELAEHLRRWRKGELREYVESISIAVLLALMLRAVVVEAFKIPSGSMLPTLQIQDHIFVNKFVYGPTIPLIRERVLARLPPERGDVIVFEFPNPEPGAEKQDFIKRVIGLPGDVLETDGGHPVINGWRVPSCRVGPYEFSEGFGARTSADLYVEFLGKHAYLTLYETWRPEQRQGPYSVKPGEVWVFGDNRDNSSDSRAWFQGRGGGVPFANVKGRAMFVWYPFGRMLVNVMGQPQLPNDAADELVRGVERCLAERPPIEQTTPPSPPSR